MDTNRRLELAPPASEVSDIPSIVHRFNAGGLTANLLGDMVNLVTRYRDVAPKDHGVAGFLVELCNLRDHTEFVNMDPNSKRRFLASLLYSYVVTEPGATGILATEYQLDREGSVQNACENLPVWLASNEDNIARKFSGGSKFESEVELWKEMTALLAELPAKDNRQQVGESLATVACLMENHLTEGIKLQRRIDDSVSTLRERYDKVRQDADDLNTHLEEQQRIMRELDEMRKPKSPRELLAAFVKQFRKTRT